MRVLALEVAQFRNLLPAVIEPHPRFNVLAGDNGQGKTNVLEAIYLLGTLRSFRAAKTEEMVQFGPEGAAPRATARARVSKLGVERLLEVALSPGHKQARVDGKGARAGDYFGGFNVVLFAPEDLRLPRGAPSGRRRFLDRAIWNAHPAYLAEAQTYDRVLKSRNALLRDNGPADLLDVYDEQLARAAVPLVQRRRSLVEELRPLTEHAFARVTQTGLRLEMDYETELDISNIHDSMLNRLHNDMRKDRARGATSSGPHADDLDLVLDGKSAKLYASQGQLRAIVLALKIAEIEYLRAKLGDAPVLLLDDVSSELDPTRNAQLFDFLRSVPCQAFITTTHPQHVLLSEDRLDFRVVAGRISI
jgi:DNA replication and repair protein RecF